MSDPKDAMTDFHKARKDSDEFSGADGFKEFQRATDKLAKDLNAPTYDEYLQETKDD